MKVFVKTNGRELQVEGARERMLDPGVGCRASVTVTMKATVEEAKAVFSGIGAWQCIRRDEEGADIKTLDCSRYEILHEIRDHLDGTVSVIMVAPKMEEVMEILTGGE